jgi:ubiquinone/menaquinone biosynthesis C-methylase UbiE
MPDFSVRSFSPEKMDDLNVNESELRKNLDELEIVNRLLGGYNVVLNALEKINFSTLEITVLDVGSGGGDTLRTIAKWAQKKNLSINLIGVDWNPVMTKYAEEKSKSFSNIQFKTINVFDDILLNERADIVMNNLFCHHFTDVELVKLIQRMNQLASRAVIINDLHRHWFAYYSIKIITSIFSKTYLVKYDAPLSVARSLTKDEWKKILFDAGIENYSLKWMWAWRWQIIIDKTKW